MREVYVPKKKKKNERSILEQKKSIFNPSSGKKYKKYSDPTENKIQISYIVKQERGIEKYSIIKRRSLYFYWDLRVCFDSRSQVRFSSV